MAKYYTFENHELRPTQDFRSGAWVSLTDTGEFDTVIKQISPAETVSATLHLDGKDVKVIFTDKCVITVSEVESHALEACIKPVITALFGRNIGTENNLPDMMEIFNTLSSVEMVTDEYASFDEFVSRLENSATDNETSGVFTVICAKNAEPLFDNSTVFTSNLEKAFPKAKLLWTIIADDSINGVRFATILGK